MALRRGASHAERIFFETRMTMNDHKYVINKFVDNSWIIHGKKKESNSYAKKNSHNSDNSPTRKIKTANGTNLTNGVAAWSFARRMIF